MAHLDDRKQAIYENLRDLQFEYRLGKLSDQDYQQTKQSLQRELAGVLSETEQTMKRLGMEHGGRKPKQETVTLSPALVQAAAQPVNTCSFCGATFPQALKFCGECGKPMA